MTPLHENLRNALPACIRISPFHFGLHFGSHVYAGELVDGDHGAAA